MDSNELKKNCIHCMQGDEDGDLIVGKCGHLFHETCAENFDSSGLSCEITHIGTEKVVEKDLRYIKSENDSNLDHKLSPNNERSGDGDSLDTAQAARSSSTVSGLDSFFAIVDKFTDSVIGEESDNSPIYEQAQKNWDQIHNRSYSEDQRSLAEKLNETSLSSMIADEKILEEEEEEEEDYNSSKNENRNVVTDGFHQRSYSETQRSLTDKLNETSYVAMSADEKILEEDADSVEEEKIEELSEIPIARESKLIPTPDEFTEHSETFGGDSFEANNELEKRNNHFENFELNGKSKDLDLLPDMNKETLEKEEVTILNEDEIAVPKSSTIHEVQLDSDENEVSRLVIEITKQKKELKEKLEKKEKDISDLNNVIAEQKLKLSDYESFMGDLNEKNEKKNAISTLKDHFNQLKKEKELLLQEKEQYEKALKSHMSECGKIESVEQLKTIENLESQLSKQEEEISRLTKSEMECDNLKKSLSDHKKDMKEKDEMILELRKKSKHLDEMKLKFEKNEEIKSNYLRDIDDLKNLLEDKSRQMQELKNEVIDLRNDNSRLNEKLNETVETVTLREKQVKQLEEEMNALNINKDEEVNNLTNELEELKKQLNESVENVTSKEKKVKELEEEINALNMIKDEEVNNLINELEELKNQLNESAETVTFKDGTIADLKVRNKDKSNVILPRKSSRTDCSSDCDFISGYDKLKLDCIKSGKSLNSLSGGSRKRKSSPLHFDHSDSQGDSIKYSKLPNFVRNAVASIDNVEKKGIRKRTPLLTPGQLDGKKEEKKKEEEKLPEELQSCDPKLVEMISNEILDRGTQVKWDDIAGLEFAKQCVKEFIIWPMQKPEFFKGLLAPPKGLLLFGPPGTGKTMIGKAIASEAGATFFSISASSLGSKWHGEGEKLVRTLFAVAVFHQPSIIFIDEIDSLLCQRSDSEFEGDRRMKTEFLIRLEGASTTDDERVLVIGATNRPQELDEAARRRLVKRLYVPLPNFEARKQLFVSLIEKQKHSLSNEDMQELVKKTKGYSGADIRALCREAAYGPIRSIGDLSEFDGKLRSMNKIDFLQAFSQVRASVSPDDLHHYEEWNKLYGSYQLEEKNIKLS